MSPLTRDEADALLEEAELVAGGAGGLREVKELLGACLEAGIPAAMAADPIRDAMGGPRAQLLVRPEDVDRVRALMRDRWMALVEGLGVELKEGPAQELPEEGDPPCPACGTAAPLVNGACSDCGLQLE